MRIDPGLTLEDLELTNQLGAPAAGEDLAPYDAYFADEAFLATAYFCILPVGRIDKRPVGSEVPGPITKRLLAAWSELVGLDIAEQPSPKFDRRSHPRQTAQIDTGIERGR